MGVLASHNQQYLLPGQESIDLILKRGNRRPFEAIPLRLEFMEDLVPRFGYFTVGFRPWFFFRNKSNKSFQFLCSEPGFWNPAGRGIEFGINHRDSGRVGDSVGERVWFYDEWCGV